MMSVRVIHQSRGISIGIGLLVCLSFQCIPFSAKGGDPVDRETVRRTLLEARHLGAHGYAYNADSLAELRKKLSPETIPVLFELLVHGEETRAGAIAGLASQCGAAIDPIYQAATQGTVPFAYVLVDALSFMERTDLCSMEERQQAVKAIADLDRWIEAEQAKNRQAMQEQRARRAELTKRGVLMLVPEGKSSISINDCLELVWESRKATGIDPTKSDASQQLLNRQIANCYGRAPRSVN
jgi:hypothetical protein